MTVKLLFRAPQETGRILRQADVLDQACSIEYRDITGKENKLPRHPDLPVVCVQIESGYWELRSNDPEFQHADELAARLRKWENAPAMQ